jgi:hypothetical protein
VLAPADSTEQVMSIAAPVAVPRLERAGVDPYAEIGPAPDGPISEAQLLEIDRLSASEIADADVIDAEIVDDSGSDAAESVMDALFEAVNDGEFGDTGFPLQFVELLRTQVDSNVSKLQSCLNGVRDGSIIPKIVDGKAVKGRP